MLRSLLKKVKLHLKLEDQDGQHVSLANSPPKLGSSSPNLRPNMNKPAPTPVSPLMLDSGFGDSAGQPQYDEYDE